eukprot:3229920-Pyramimonas_sp.AAC.1
MCIRDSPFFTRTLHVPSSAVRYPELHTQSAKLVLASKRVLRSGGQSSHCAGPATALYLPAGHGLHTSSTVATSPPPLPTAAEKPGAHTHSSPALLGTCMSYVGGSGFDGALVSRR